MTTSAGNSRLDQFNYDEPVEALRDARRVIEDLRGLADEHLLIPRDALEFLARRAGALIDACIDAEQGRVS